MTFGSRKSHFTPAAWSLLNNSFGCSCARIDNWQPRASVSLGVIIAKRSEVRAAPALDWPLVPARCNRKSRWPVGLIEFAQSASIPPASSTIDIHATHGAIEKIGGFLICQLSAEGPGFDS